MRKAIIPIRSIDRYLNAEGGCDFIVNLRPAGQKWKPVRNKSRHLFVGEHDGIFHHHVLPENHVIVVNYFSRARISRRSLSASGSVLVQTIDSIEATDVKISAVGNVLIVNSDKIIRFYLYQPDKDTYTQLEKLEAPGLGRTKETKLYKIGPAYPSEFDTFLAGMFEHFKTMEASNFYRGNILATSAFELVDGTTILHNQILSDDLEFENSPNEHESWVRWPEQKVPHPHILHNYGGTVTPAFVPNNIHVSKLQYQVRFSEDLIRKLEQYKDIVRALNIYAHYIPSTFNYSSDQEDYNLVYKQYQSNQHGNLTDLIMWPKRHTNSEDFYTQVVFRKIAAISLDDIISKGEEPHQITLDLTNFNQKEILDVDNNTHHSIISLNDPYTFNNASHYPGVITQFGKGYRQNAEWDLEMNDITKLWNFKNLPSTFSPGTRTIIQVVEILTDDGLYFAEKRIQAKVWGPSGNQLLIEPFLSYPDRRAQRIYFLKEDKQIIASYDLKPHASLNIAYHIIKEEESKSAALSAFERKFIPGAAEVLSYDENKLFVQPYRLQVSETNNPLYFPARYSYEINKSEMIISCTSVAEEVGTGQRGQFPLFLFSDNQIYLLQQGQGDILYQQIIPLHRIQIKGKAVAVSRNVMFAAHDGLYIMDGQGQISNISRSISNPPEILPDYPDIGSSIHPIPFDEFLENSIFLYDNRNREILISNPALGCSYIYNMDHQAWFIKTEYFLKSLVIQSRNYFVKDTAMYSTDESQGETLPFFIQSNILLFSTTSYKKIIRSVLRGRPKTDTQITFTIFSEYFGSYNKTSQSTKSKENAKVEILISRMPGSAKSFIFTVAGKLTDDGEIHFWENVIVESLNKKIR